MKYARAVLLFATAIASAADRVPSEFFPPQTRIVIGLSLRALLDSPLFEAAGGGATLTAAAGPFAGIDLLKDLDSIVIASEGDTKTAPGIVVARGRFRPMAAAGMHHAGIPIFEDKKGVLALLDANTAIAGSLADVKAAIDRRGGASTLSPSLGARIAAVEANDFWAVGDVPESKSGGKAQSIDRFDFGASLRKGLEVHGSVHLRSPEEAAQLAMMIKMFEGMLKTQPSKTAAKFNLRADGGTLTVDLFIPEAELKRTVTTQRNALAGMVRSQFPGALPAAAPAPAPASAPSPARPPISRPPATPATIVTNSTGETVQVVLPGGN
jgi:hypothetical protein